MDNLIFVRVLPRFCSYAAIYPPQYFEIINQWKRKKKSIFMFEMGKNTVLRGIIISDFKIPNFKISNFKFQTLKLTSEILKFEILKSEILKSEILKFEIWHVKNLGANTLGHLSSFANVDLYVGLVAHRQSLFVRHQQCERGETTGDSRFCHNVYIARFCHIFDAPFETHFKHRNDGQTRTHRTFYCHRYFLFMGWV